MLETLDWIVVIVFLSAIFLIGLSFTKRAGKNLESFFLGGRNLPWYIAGLSMVATTFAADTPLAVTELVAQNGISGNWLWWNALAGGMLTTFFFSHLWRRAEILTEIEFIELRYHGPVAAFLRGFRAIYLGLIMNVLVIGWVNVALVSLIQVFFGVPPAEAIYYVAAVMFGAAIFASASGLMGVAITDVIQFVVAMIGCIVLAYFVLATEQVGGITGLKSQLPAETFEFFPSIGGGEEGSSKMAIGLSSFIAFFGFVWWTSWYPGAEPGGGGYVAQRMMSTKSEKSSVLATLLFYVTHICIRPWPWIIVALCSLVLYPNLAAGEEKLGYVMAMRDHLPAGFKGLLFVAFLAAYISTISTQLNWGASYLVNDVYKRFLNPEADNRNLILVSRLATLLLMLVGLYVSTLIESISGVWQFIMECGAGLGLVLILRWYWWRINAWSEIVATITPFLVYAVCWYQGIEFPTSFFWTVGITTVAWIVATYVTQPTNEEHLKKFYNKITPDGMWGPIKHLSNAGKKSSDVKFLLISWISAVVMTYSCLFLIGKIIFREWPAAGMWGGIALVAAIVLGGALNKTKLFNRH